MTDETTADPVIEGPARRPRFSAAWLVPLIALAISLGVAWRSYSDRGPLIEIVFETGAGLEAGKTPVKFRDLDIGLVEEVALADDLSNVVASVRIDKDSARHVGANTEFWLVSAQVGPQGISGLDTVLSGAYIAADFDTEPGAPRTTFEALAKPPLTALGQDGLRISIRAPEGGSVSVGAPVLFKRIPVGQVEDVSLTERGDVLITAFIDAPADARVTSATRFWNTSGFRVELSTAGASLNVESLAALIQGGIAFDTVTSGGEPVGPDTEFRLFQSENEARVVILNDDPSARVNIMANFSGSVRGLAIGAPVEYRGIQVGEVTELQAEVIRVDDSPLVTVRATLGLNPSRFGLPQGDQANARAMELIEVAVERGVRARLASGNILTGSLFVELAEIPDAEPASVDMDARPWPEVPTAAASASGLAQTAEGVLARVENLPVEEMMGAITTLISNANLLITDEAIRTAPENLGLLLSDLRTLVADSGLEDIPAEITAILASTRNVVDRLAEDRIVDSLAAALDATTGAVESLQSVAEGVPPLLDEVTALTAEARQLPLEDLVASGVGVVEELQTLIRSEAVASLPVAVDAAIGDLRGLLVDIRDGGAIENVNATLASIRAVTDELAAARLTESLRATLAAAETAAANVSTSTSELPALVDNLSRLSETAAGLPLDELTAASTRLLGTADTLLASEGMADVPPQLSASLRELSLILAELREGGAVENLNTTLASADAAADAVSAAAQDLPALLDRLTSVAARADTTLSSFGPGSEINRDTLLLLREVRDAARSVNSLVSALERRPNSVLFGR